MMILVIIYFDDCDNDNDGVDDDDIYDYDQTFSDNHIIKLCSIKNNLNFMMIIMSMTVIIIIICDQTLIDNHIIKL